MSPTILPGDRVLAHKRFGEIRRWDLVVFKALDPPGERHVLRVVGLPGETVELVGSALHVNGSPVAPPPGVGPYQQPLARFAHANAAEGDPLTLADDEYFVLGDNPTRARDGRYWDTPADPHRQTGALPRDRIVAKVTTRYWPPSRWRRFP
jgi:signal peptidase I